jgi:hypothetical protein
MALKKQTRRTSGRIAVASVATTYLSFQRPTHRGSLTGFRRSSPCRAHPTASTEGRGGNVIKLFLSVIYGFLC